MYGWEPATTYEHDDAGRLVSSRPEPEWTDEERAWLLALAAYRKLLCPGGCGNLAEESLNPDNEYRYQAIATRCHACAAISREANREDRDRSAGGMLFSAGLG